MPKYTYSIYDGHRDRPGNKPIHGFDSVELEAPNDDFAIDRITETVTRLERVYDRTYRYLCTHISSDEGLREILVTDSEGTI